jgi:hypothetical protein
MKFPEISIDAMNILVNMAHAFGVGSIAMRIERNIPIIDRGTLRYLTNPISHSYRIHLHLGCMVGVQAPVHRKRYGKINTTIQVDRKSLAFMSEVDLHGLNIC